MEQAYLIGVDVNDGSGSREFEPPLNRTYEAGLSRGTIDPDKMTDLRGTSLVIPKLVRGRFPEVVGMSTGPFTVAPAIRDWLDEHEPGVHQFYPMPVKTKKPADGKTEHGIHWLLYPPPVIDCLDFDRTVFNYDVKGKPWVRERSPESNVWGGGLRKDSPSYLTRNLLDGRHLWRLKKGGDEGSSTYACSPDFWSFYKSHKMIGWTVRITCHVA